MLIHRPKTNAHFVTASVCFCCVLLSALGVSSSPSQSRRQIPEVEVPCTPDEAKWWEEIRQTGTEVQKSRGNKMWTQFLQLIKAGKTNSYRPPILDRKPTFLAVFVPQYSEAGRRDRIRGTVLLQVEFQSNGTVGEVVVVKGIRSDLDHNAIEAARQTAFLPAVKERQFETVWMPMEMRFDVY